MMLYSPDKLSSKSARASLLTVSAALIFATVLLISFQFVSLRKSIVEDVTVQSRIIAENSVAAVMFNDVKGGEDILGSLRTAPSVCTAAIFTKDHRLMARFVNNHADVPSIEDGVLNPGHEMNMSHLTVTENIVADGRVIGAVVLRVDLHNMYERLATSALITSSIVLASLGFAYLLVTRMRRVVSETEAHLTYLAHVDSVTGLPNRHAFNERLVYTLARVKRFDNTLELLFLDLDNFKVVNDTLGHENGDLLLRAVAERLQGALRSSDIICRIGGDEFAIIIEARSKYVRGSEVARKIIATLSEPYSIGPHEIYVTGSIGVACCSGNDADLPTLTRNADTAMYQAKARGKNTYAVFEEEMDHCAQKRLTLENSLRKALERDELSLQYQPKLNLMDDTIVGFEALLRWNHPELGAVSPAEFIPVAEECGLIVPIGRWVIETACRDLAAWRDQGHDIRVAVNLSVRQTRSDTLVDDIQSALSRWDLQPDHLGLEITESVLMENIEGNISLLEQLRAFGVKLSIDDFGTGYSSLAYLKRFQIDELKIDRAFVKDIPGDGEDEAIVTAIVALAHSLGLAVVAEGVETAAQLAFMRTVGCDQIQGYHFSRPMEVNAATEFLSSRNMVRIA